MPVGVANSTVEAGPNKCGLFLSMGISVSNLNRTFGEVQISGFSGFWSLQMYVSNINNRLIYLLIYSLIYVF